MDSIYGQGVGCFGHANSGWARLLAVLSLMVVGLELAMDFLVEGCLLGLSASLHTNQSLL